MDLFKKRNRGNFIFIYSSLEKALYPGVRLACSHCKNIESFGVSTKNYKTRLSLGISGERI